ncbi:GTPase ObgE [Candidatus Peregrinibacteria bacterium HGW-Peregrinibacteria-1]|jgi:GTP-binding protein|nr:MAG: GTPase ObgE [Candidatus Peregrinibacteria bacterium HGW-Peregrinibacteria-1]
MFSDEVQIKVIAGKGGNGCASFRREKFVPKGGPDGGDGGRGGSVIIKVNPHINTLSYYTNKKAYNAENGTPGKGKKMHGRNGEHLILEVPPGTMVFNKQKTEMYADLNHDGDQVIITKGGLGGKGNVHFVSSTHQAPKFAEKGEPGEERDIILELKLVADVGIIGLPSAGKSTLISVISNAKPKIAAYHFTTIVPNLGVVDMKKFGGSSEESFVVADIPGLIEGASEGKGLGHQFLKHISRNNILVHLLDGTSSDIKKDHQTVRKELKKYDADLYKKPEIIAINKSDLLTPEEITEKSKLFSPKALVVSAATTDGIKQLVYKILEKLQVERSKPKPQPIIKTPVLRPHLEKGKYQLSEILKEGDHNVFMITGHRIEQIMVMTDLGNPEGLERMYHYISRLGIQDAIEKKGANYGDIIRIKGFNIPYRK